jgi:hypothetical protein
MIKIDDDLLFRVGLGSLSDELKNLALRTFYELLELRVGVALAERMTDEQLAEFEAFFKAKDDAGAFEWLSTNLPEYKDIVLSEFERLEAEADVKSAETLERVETLMGEHGVKTQRLW